MIPTFVKHTWIMRTVAWGSVALAFVAICVAITVGDLSESPVASRFVTGGLALALAGFSGIGVWSQLTTGTVAVPVRRSFWRIQVEYIAKEERLFRFWCTTLIYIVCTLIFIVWAAVSFLVGYQLP